jgi:hypothetical protein
MIGSGRDVEAEARTERLSFARVASFVGFASTEAQGAKVEVNPRDFFES